MRLVRMGKAINWINSESQENCVTEHLVDYILSSDHLEKVSVII